MALLVNGKLMQHRVYVSIRDKEPDLFRLWILYE